MSDTDISLLSDITDTDQFQQHQTVRDKKRKLDFSVVDCWSNDNPKRWRFNIRDQHNELVIMDNEMLPVSDSESGSDIVELPDFQSEDDYSHNDEHDSRSILFDNDLQIFPPEQPPIEKQVTNIIDELVDQVVPQPQPPIAEQDTNIIDEPVDQVDPHPTDDDISAEVIQDEAVDVAPPPQSPIPTYHQVKLRPEPVLQVWLNIKQYKSLSKQHQEQISNRWQSEVKYPNKLRDRFSFRATPSKISFFINHYKTYFPNEEITFSIKVLFNGNVENADHEQHIFNSLFQSKQITRTKNAPFPTTSYIFNDITIGTFNNFVSTFSVE